MIILVISVATLPSSQARQLVQASPSNFVWTDCSSDTHGYVRNCPFQDNSTNVAVRFTFSYEVEDDGTWVAGGTYNGYLDATLSSVNSRIVSSVAVALELDGLEDIAFAPASQVSFPEIEIRTNIRISVSFRVPMTAFSNADFQSSYRPMLNAVYLKGPSNWKPVSPPYFSFGPWTNGPNNIKAPLQSPITTSAESPLATRSLSEQLMPLPLSIQSVLALVVFLFVTTVIIVKASKRGRRRMAF